LAAGGPESRHPSAGVGVVSCGPVIVNNTPYAVAEAVLAEPDGREVYLAIIKASFRWRPEATVEPLPEPVPFAAADVYAGEPGKSGLVTAGELTLPKPRVDLLLAGEIVPRAPVEALDCTLELGRQLRKTLRVFGDRYWRPSTTKSVLPSRPKPFSRMPIAWERSFGGTDPDDPAVLDLRNPVGRGICKNPRTLEGKPAPNFEDPAAPIDDPLRRPAPVGFGPIAPYWRPRSERAGTYDARWESERSPLLPKDFDPRFLNAAPEDQQLDRYLPDTELWLTDFTPGRRERIRLPAFAPALTVVEGRTIFEVSSVVDTIVVEPAEARLSLVARAVYRPKSVAAIATAYLGPLSRGQRRALHAGKPYLRLGG
jgi:hypothetical protein